MPTGYTHGVQNGTVTTLKEFAILCARGMGATIMMRDDSLDTPIPERFEPSDHNAECLAEAKAEREKILAMSDAEIEQAALAAFQVANDYFIESSKERAEQEKRYKDMLAKVEAWDTEAEGIRDFMLSQLKESIDFDCGYKPSAPKLMTAAEWRVEALAQADHNIAYHTKGHAEEVERTESRNDWLRKLRASL